MTPAQLQAIKADILANPDLTAWANEGNHGMIAEMYKAQASPDFYVWRSSLSIAEMFDSFIEADWTAMDNLTVGQDRIWINLKESGSIKPASSAHRAALAECWKGTAAKTAVRDRIYDTGKRLANRLEKVLATGTGSFADPATMGYEGTIDWQIVKQALES